MQPAIHRAVGFVASVASAAGPRTPARGGRLRREPAGAGPAAVSAGSTRRPGGGWPVKPSPPTRTESRPILPRPAAFPSALRACRASAAGPSEASPGPRDPRALTGRGRPETLLGRRAGTRRRRRGATAVTLLQHPGSLAEWRIMADVPVVEAGHLGHPVTLGVLVGTEDRPDHG